jgi:uncharacterized phage protein (TIGR02216 family)
VSGRGSGVDWPVLMRLGLGALRLAPEAFWAMTPVELIRAAEGAGLTGVREAALSRSGLEALMAAHPDPGRAFHGKGEDDGAV